MNNTSSFKNETNRIINFYSYLDKMLVNEDINNIENYQFLFEEINTILEEFFESLSKIKKMNYISNGIYFKIEEYLDKFFYFLEYLVEFEKFAEKNPCFGEIFFEISNLLSIQKNKFLFFIKTTKEYLFVINSDNKLIKILNEIEIDYEKITNSVEENKKKRQKNRYKKMSSGKTGEISNKFKTKNKCWVIIIGIIVLYLICLFFS